MPKQTVIDIDLERLRSNGNIRKSTNNLNELVSSLRENGQKVPIQVYGHETGFIIKYGHRRVEAARILGWQTIRAVVENGPEYLDTLVTDQAIENLHREGMTYLEMAGVYQSLRERFQWSQTRIATKFGISDAQVSLALSMLRADQTLQDAVNSGRMSPSAVEPLLALPLTEQKRLAPAAIRAKTVRAVKALVDTHWSRARSADIIVDRENEINEDMEPEELMSLADLDEALRHLKKVQEAEIKHPELKSRARPTVQELIAMAKKILKELED